MDSPSNGIPIIGGGEVARPARLDKIGMATPLPSKGYYPTLMFVACAKCKSVGTIYFPQGFDYKIGDKIMDGKVFKAKCEIKCFEETEMVPIGIRQAMQDLPGLIRRYYMDLKRIVMQGGMLSKEDMEFGRVYEKLYGIDGYPPGYDVPVEGQTIPDELKDVLIRKGATT